MNTSIFRYLELACGSSTIGRYACVLSVYGYVVSSSRPPPEGCCRLISLLVTQPDKTRPVFVHALQDCPPVRFPEYVVLFILLACKRFMTTDDGMDGQRGRHGDEEGSYLPHAVQRRRAPRCKRRGRVGLGGSTSFPVVTLACLPHSTHQSISTDGHRRTDG